METHDLELLEQQEILRKRDELINTVQKNDNVWGHSFLGRESKNAAMAMLSTKTGLYAKVPITCKGDGCPYAETCKLLERGMAPYGEPCSWETAIIETRYVGYMEDYELDTASYTDNTMVSELINLDVQLERQKALIAKEGISIIDVVAGITESGEQFTRPEISKAQELYERTLSKKIQLLDKLLGTRSSRKGMGGSTSSITDMLQEVIATDDFIVEEVPEEFKHLKK